MSGGGGIFGGLGTLDKKVTEFANPVTKYLDPINTAVHKAVSQAVIDTFVPKAPGQQAATTTTQQENAATNTAKAQTAAAGGGTGAGAKDLVTQPPNTPEGNRMRLSQGAALAGAANTLLGN